MAAFTPMWSMMSGEPRMALGDRSRTSTRWPDARNITGSPAFSAAGQNQSAVPSDEPCRIVLRIVEGHPHAEHARLLLPLRQQRRRFRVLQRDAAHDREAVGIALVPLRAHRSLTSFERRAAR